MLYGQRGLKSVLQSEEAFVSYAFMEDVLVFFGDATGIGGVVRCPRESVEQPLSAFLRVIGDEDRCYAFVHADLRPPGWVPRCPGASDWDDLRDTLASLLVPDVLRRFLIQKPYGRLLVFPDGPLHAVPLGELIRLSIGSAGSQFVRGVVYAPSASAYVYCALKHKEGRPEHALLLIGDPRDERICSEASSIASIIPCTTTVVKSRREMQEHERPIDLLYVVSHGKAPSASPAPNDGIFEEKEWRLAFDPPGHISSEDFFDGRIRVTEGATVVFSACSVGRLMPGDAREVHGLIRSTFYAGAAAVLVARWPVLYEAAEIVFGHTIQYWMVNHMSLGQAFERAKAEAVTNPSLESLMAAPGCESFFVDAFALYGWAGGS